VKSTHSWMVASADMTIGILYSGLGILNSTAVVHGTTGAEREPSQLLVYKAIACCWRRTCRSVTVCQVTKERLAVFRGPQAPKDAPAADLGSASYLHHLLLRREDALFMEIGGEMKRAGKDGLFAAWMYSQSDLVQAAAVAYAERLASEQFLNVISKADADLRSVLDRLYRLYAVDCIERALGWYALSDAGMPRDMAKAIPAEARRLCHELAPEAIGLAEAFGLTDAMLSAPIAGDWIGYNQYDNRGEVIAE